MVKTPSKEEHPWAEVLLVVPVHDRAQELRELLTSLRTLDTTGISLAVAIVDDASPAPIEAQLTGEFADFDIRFHRNETSRGPGYCRNLAARKHPSRYLWFLDSDTEILSPGVLRHLIDLLLQSPLRVGTGGVLEDVNGKRVLQELHILPNYLFLYRSHPPEDYPGAKVDGIGSCNLFLERGAYERAGGFAEDLPRDEDNDLCLSIRRSGRSLYQDAKSVVLHKCSPSGRATGAFAHFAVRKRYIHDLLHTRVAVIARHQPWKLPLLPLLDALLAPLIALRIARGFYATKRFAMGTQPQSNSAATLALLVLESLKAYASGFGLWLKRSPAPIAASSDRSAP